MGNVSFGTRQSARNLAPFHFLPRLGEIEDLRNLFGIREIEVDRRDAVAVGHDDRTFDAVIMARLTDPKSMVAHEII